MYTNMQSKLERDYDRWRTDQLQIWCGISFLQYLVSYYTTCVQHSSDKTAKCKFTLLHWYEIHTSDVTDGKSECFYKTMESA